MPALAVPITIMSCFITTVVLVWLVKSYLEKRQIFDVPNSRSMHSHETVRGGGVAITLVILVFCFFLGVLYGTSVTGLMILIAGLSLLGLLDDIRPIFWWMKLLVQFILAMIFIYLDGATTDIDVFGLQIVSAQLVAVSFVFWIVYMCNIYNFMDGIDGIASSYCALCACVLGVWFLLAQHIDLALLCFATMAASMGFLVWNWHPAKIFLGDSGSVMLGGLLAAIAIIGAEKTDIPFGAFLILFSVFLGDASYTLISRLLKGERIWMAHRSHLYQRAVQVGLSHSRVTGMVLLITLILVIPATLEARNIGSGLIWALIPIVGLVLVSLLIARFERRNAISNS